MLYILQILIFICFFSCFIILSHNIQFLKPKDFLLMYEFKLHGQRTFSFWLPNIFLPIFREILILRQSLTPLQKVKSLDKVVQSILHVIQVKSTRDTSPEPRRQRQGLKKQKLKRIYFGIKWEWSPMSSESCGIWFLEDAVVVSFLRLCAT